MPERTPTHIDGQPFHQLSQHGCSAAVLYLRAFPAVDQLDLTFPFEYAVPPPPFPHLATITLGDASGPIWQGTVTSQRLHITATSRHWQATAKGIAWQLEQHIYSATTDDSDYNLLSAKWSSGDAEKVTYQPDDSPDARVTHSSSSVDVDGLIDARAAIEDALSYAGSQGALIHPDLDIYEGTDRIPALSTSDNTVANELWTIMQWMPQCRLVFSPTWPSRASVIDIRAASPYIIDGSEAGRCESAEVEARYDLVREGLVATTIEDRSLLLDGANIRATDPITGSHYRRTLRTAAGDPIYGTVTSDVDAIMDSYGDLVSWVQALKHDGQVVQRIDSVPVPIPVRVVVHYLGPPAWGSMLAPWQETSLDIMTGQRTIVFAADSSLAAADFATLNESLVPRTVRAVSNSPGGSGLT